MKIEKDDRFLVLKDSPMGHFENVNLFRDQVLIVDQVGIDLSFVRFHIHTIEGEKMTNKDRMKELVEEGILFHYSANRKQK